LEEDQQARKKALTQLVKGLLEIVAIYFLAASIIQMFSPLPQDENTLFSKQSAFAVFLLSSFFWNMVVLGIMKQVSFKELLWAGVTGSVYDLKGTSQYTGRFKELTSAAEESLRTSGEVRDVMHHYAKFATCLLRESFGRFAGQLVALHITLANLFVFLFLVFSGIFNRAQLYGNWWSSKISSSAIKL